MKNWLLVALALVPIACSSIEVASQESSVATTTLASLQSQFKFPERFATDGTNVKLPARSVIPQSTVTSLKAINGGNLAPATSLDAQVTLPANAAGATTVSTTNGTMSISVSLRGANSTAPALITGGNALYLKGDSHGGHVVQTVIREGVESFVVFGASPTTDAVFDVAMAGVSGLRFGEGVLEFLDKDGAPRLRMAPPVVVDSNGAVADVTTTVEGCAYDDSPQAPWGRKVTAPGAASCAVHLSWSDQGLTYPVLLDPSWTTTGSMITARRWHGAILLPTLKVLVAGGEGISTPYLTTCELYDPSTGTWGRAAPMDPGRRRFTTTMIDGGKVLIAGGEVLGGRTASAEFYDPATGRWTPTGSMSTTRAYNDAVYLSSVGKVLVAGGMNTSGAVLQSAELYNPGTGTWSTTGSLATARQNLTLTALRDQTALAAGGVDGSSNVLASSEIYNPGAGTWSAGASLTTARHRHRAVRLDDDRVVFTGGFTDAAATSTTAAGEVYDSTLAAFFVQDAVGNPRGDHGAIALPENRVLVVGGTTGSSPLADTQMYGADNATSISNGNLAVPTAQQSATLMGNGYVLVAGGTSPSGITNIATTSGPYFYVYGRNGQAHQMQFTSVSGSWENSFSFGLKYDSTAFSVTYDWVGGVGASLRATVYDAVGTLLGTVVTAHKGNATFTSADGSQQATYNRNLVPPSALAFLDEKVLIVGPEYIMGSGVIDKFTSAGIAHLPQWFNEWTFTLRDPLGSMSAQNQANLWQALTDITFDTSHITCVGKPCTYHVRAQVGPLGGPDEETLGGLIQYQDCTPTSCQADMAWFDVDVVRAHYEIDHSNFPQFFKHHRRYLDQIESWIRNPGGWQDANSTYGVLPSGHLPYWDPSAAVPNNNYSPGNNFVYAQLSGGGVPFGQGRNCSTGATYNDLHGLSSSGRVDTFFNPAPSPDPPGGCDWESKQTFGNSTYTLAYPTTNLCTANNQDWFWGTTACAGSGSYNDPAQGFHCFHDDIHNGLGDNTGVFFDALDSPSYPLFFPWHAWVDWIYKKRLDCYGFGP